MNHLYQIKITPTIQVLTQPKLLIGTSYYIKDEKNNDLYYGPVYWDSQKNTGYINAPLLSNYPRKNNIYKIDVYENFYIQHDLPDIISDDLVAVSWNQEGYYVYYNKYNLETPI